MPAIVASAVGCPEGRPKSGRPIVGIGQRGYNPGLMDIYSQLWEEMKRSARELAGDQAERFCRLPAPSNPAEYLQREAELSALVQRIHAGGVAPGAGLTSAEQS